MSDDPTRDAHRTPDAAPGPVRRFEAREGIEALLRLDGAAARSWATRRTAAGAAGPTA